MYEKWNRPDPTRPGPTRPDPTARLPALRTPDLGPPVLTPFGCGRATVTQILRFALVTLAPFAHPASGRATVTQILRLRRATLAPFAHSASGRATVTQILRLRRATLAPFAHYASGRATLTRRQNGEDKKQSGTGADGGWRKLSARASLAGLFGSNDLPGYLYMTNNDLLMV